MSVDGRMAFSACAAHRWLPVTKMPQYERVTLPSEFAPWVSVGYQVKYVRRTEKGHTGVGELGRRTEVATLNALGVLVSSVREATEAPA